MQIAANCAAEEPWMTAVAEMVDYNGARPEASTNGYMPLLCQTEELSWLQDTHNQLLLAAEEALFR